VEGEVLDGRRLLSLIDGMERNGLLAAASPSSSSSEDEDGPRIGNILTGYIGSASFLSAVVQIVHKLKTCNPACRYICDPVLGDHGKFYVPVELVHIYKRDVLPIADIITPNQFEIEQLTGITISNIIDAQIACGMLHDMGVNTVLITSIVFPSPTTTDATAAAATDTIPPPPATTDSIAMFASHRNNSKAKIEETTTTTNLNTNASTIVEGDEQYILYTPKLPGQYTGTGDVCAALFLGWTAITAEKTVHDKTDENNDSMSSSSSLVLSTSLEKVGGTMHAIVKRTAAAASACTTGTTSTAKLVSSRELQLISSRDDIIYPPRLFHAVQVPSLSSTTATPTTSNS
jgi:pyridoxine kinase